MDFLAAGLDVLALFFTVAYLTKLLFFSSDSIEKRSLVDQRISPRAVRA